MHIARYALAASLFAAMLAMPAAVQASIYDAEVEGKLDLTPDQLPQVRQIVAQSKAGFLAVFRKYGIDPEARPEFSKLVKASSELQALERKERSAMKKILTDEQLDKYDQLIERVRIIVRKAAQEENPSKGRR